MAMFIKKIILKKKLEAYRSAKDSKTHCINTQEWNFYLCTTPELLLIVFIHTLFQIFLAELVSLFSLNSHEKSLLTTNVQQVLLSLGPALYVYGTNKSIRHHLIHEILREICGCENLLPNMDTKNSNKMKSLSKITIQSKIMDSDSSSEIKTKSVLTQSTDISQVHTATMMKQKSIFNQLCDGMNGISTHDYFYQKNHLAIVRLKEAGFQLSNNTLEDGNCLIHALKDQMK